MYCAEGASSTFLKELKTMTFTTPDETTTAQSAWGTSVHNTENYGGSAEAAGQPIPSLGTSRDLQT